MKGNLWRVFFGGRWLPAGIPRTAGILPAKSRMLQAYGCWNKPRQVALGLWPAGSQRSEGGRQDASGPCYASGP